MTRSGAANAICWAMTPPIECPARWKRVRPSASAIASASRAITSIDSGPVPAVLDPMPRLSKVMTVNRSRRPSTCGCQPRPMMPTPWTRRSGGPDPARS